MLILKVEATMLETGYPAGKPSISVLDKILAEYEWRV